jgi:hypothetical protein
MTKLTLTWIKREEKMSAAKENKPARKYTSVSIKTQEYGDKYLSGFGNEDNQGWKEGDTVEVESVEEKEYNGKKYLNFNMAKGGKGGASQADIAKIITMLTNLTVAVTTNQTLIRKVGRILEEEKGVVATKDGIVPKSMEELAQEEFDGLDYPENTLDEAFPNEE